MIATHKDQWEMLGDEVATSIMTEGFRLGFVKDPALVMHPPPEAVISEKTAKALLAFVPKWLKSGVIREVMTPIPLHYSRLFMTPKKNGKLRPIIDLSILNRLLIVPTFRMETVSVISKSILKGLWACSVDIEDAYFHVPMDWDCHKFLAFRLWGRTFVFQFLPFGLSPAPWAFTRVIKPIKKHLHLLLIQIFSFLDDFILFANSPSALSAATEVTLSLLQSLGFRVNWEKSNLLPAQVVEFLGVSWDLRDCSLSVPQDKRVAIIARCREMSQRVSATRRELESLTGLINFAATYVVLGRLHLLPIMMWVNLHTQPCSRDESVHLDVRFKELLEIWMCPDFLDHPVPMHVSQPSLTLMTDASLDGWCGILLPRKALGSWAPDVFQFSMNWKELKAIHLSLLEFQLILRGKTVRLLSDNTTAISCLKKQGSVKFAHLHSLSMDILEFCREHFIVLLPEHLKGVLNVLADQGSRHRPVPTEWSLDWETFAWVSNLAPPFQVDLFATWENALLPQYVSPCPDDSALEVNAFSLDWNLWTSIYLFPPMNCLLDVVNRLQEYKGSGVLIAPFWPSKGWFPPLLGRCRQDPVPLPETFRLSQTTSKGLIFHDNPCFWNLHAWIL